MLVFEERGKPEYPEKNLSEQGENQQQTQPTYDAGTENWTRATLVGGECSHHYTNPAPLQLQYLATSQPITLFPISGNLGFVATFLGLRISKRNWGKSTISFSIS